MWDRQREDDVWLHLYVCILRHDVICLNTHFHYVTRVSHNTSQVALICNNRNNNQHILFISISRHTRVHHGHYMIIFI